MDQSQSNIQLHDRAVPEEVPQQNSSNTQDNQSAGQIESKIHNHGVTNQLAQEYNANAQACQSLMAGNFVTPKTARKNLLGLPPEITVQIAAYAQSKHSEGQKDDIRDDQIAVLWKKLENMSGSARMEAVELGLDLEKMVDHEFGHPIIHIVHYIGPKPGNKITATELHPILQVCKRLRREGGDFIRGIHFQVNLLNSESVLWAIRDALVAVSEEIEHLPMLRHLEIAFYNLDEGHRRLQSNFMSSADQIHGVDTKEVGEWYASVLTRATNVQGADREVRGGGYLTPESWLSFVYEVRSADIAATLARIQV